jgi:uncharacterized protein (DUF305 family)
VSRPHLTTLSAAAVLGLSLAGCGLNQPPPIRPETANTSPQPGAGEIVQDDVHNAQDVAFAEAMIVHHRQALAVAKLANGRTGTAKVLAIAQQIDGEQTPELEEMSRWMTEWRRPVPGGTPATVGGQTVPGMLPAADVSALAGRKGTDFDRAFLTLMITHHQGGVQISQDEIRTGADERVRGLAEDINAAQAAEITDMRALLG